MNFLKKIKEKNFDEEVHHRFTRYGKGEYERLYFTITKGKDNFKVKSSFDFANSFVGMISDNMKEDSEVSGKIIANWDFKDELGIEPTKYSKRGKLYTAELKSVTLNPKQLKELYEKFKYHALLLSIKSEHFKLTTKGNLPKPGGQIKENFCSATLPLSLLEEFLFDTKQDFKEAKIKHRILIEELEIPQEYSNNFEQARFHARKKGKIIRELELDGKKETKELELNA